MLIFTADSADSYNYIVVHRGNPGIKVPVSPLLDLRAQLFKQELTMLRELLRILDQSRIAMDLAVHSIEFICGNQRRALTCELEHCRSLVGHVARDLE